MIGKGRLITESPDVRADKRNHRLYIPIATATPSPTLLWPSPWGTSVSLPPLTVEGMVDIRIGLRRGREAAP
jgi:hypothetical protein